ncbi:Proton extrusion protein PcxA [Acaryochloris thomasi RCC1774]|uniref:Proton extrusion protein PxcA n=1 Tax=Acaryochloris thomasi RCC1774 TaxID=1764569 RepID=A0A2W1JRT6_9CYAN|nr:proton extrusion protein PcxA [Acaryochloris thomasi]PZD71517.1 Proton extrusion protein PcxA [Acaryochloris thomasi RCC1774]
MRSPLASTLKKTFLAAEKWYRNTPERALEAAYQAAKSIKAIEDEHFDGQPIGFSSPYTGAVSTYFQTERDKNLRTIRRRLNEYKIGTSFVDLYPRDPDGPNLMQRMGVPGDAYDPSPEDITIEAVPEVIAKSVERQSLLDKLTFVDSVLIRYTLASTRRPQPSQQATKRQSPLIQTNEINGKVNGSNPRQESVPVVLSVQNSLYEGEFTSDDISADPSKLDSGSFVPRSILRTANRFRKELDPDPSTEEDILQDFRVSRNRTQGAVRFLLLLTILPLLTQVFMKYVVVGPVVDRFQGSEKIEIIINPEIENKVFNELSHYEQRLKFQNLTNPAPIPEADINQLLRERAVELSDEYQWELTEPIKNIFADLVSLLVFAILIARGKEQIAIIKSFFDEIIYGLSDSAKAFIIILFTDVFVGFHSPHGWEVIIESALSHFGLPLNHSFINVFIATFPVMLDTVFKYWIFRYLNQISPSAVATYRTMNE